MSTKEPTHFRPEDPSRERIILAGPMSSGKSSDLCSIAKRLVLTGAPNKVFVIDLDGGSYERLLYSSHSRFKSLRNNDQFEIIEAYDWPELVAALDHVAKNCKPGDWVCVDMIGDAWEYVQEYYTRSIYGVDSKASFLEAYRIRLVKLRKLNKGSTKGEAPPNEKVDWDVIKAHYNEWFSKLIKRLRCHVFACTGIKELRTDGFMAHDESTRKLFGRFGVVPAGEKSLGHKFHTVFIKSGDQAKGEWILNTVKDRERPALDNHVIEKDFAKDYMIGVAGWIKGKAKKAKS